MLRTVIIDDEELTREGLEAIIPWNELDFTLVGTAADGEEAISVLQNTKPDVIITDIRMPFMTGLELIEFIKPMLPDAFIIVISGHDEFRYAQKALQLGVYDFILKPFDFDYLLKILKKIKYEHILRKNSKNQALPAEDMYHLQTKFIESLSQKKLTSEKIEKKLDTYGLKEIEDYQFCYVIVQIDNFQLSIADISFEQINDSQREFYKLIKNVVNPNKKLFLLEPNNGDAFIIISAPTNSEALMKKDKTVNQIRIALKGNTNHSITIAYSKIHPGISSLPLLYRQARLALDHRFVIGYDHDIPYTDSILEPNTERKDISFNDIGFNPAEFNKSIRSTSPKDIDIYLEKIFEKIISSGHNSTFFVTMFATTIYTEILNLLNNQHLSIADLYDDPHKFYKHITLSQNIFDIREKLKDLSQKTSTYIKNATSDTCDIRIREAKTFIEANYSSYDLTLQRIAEEVNMGVCYFSSMFKKETGDSFINYLTGIRIEKAKELFERTDMMAYEVSSVVGYNTPTYFSTIFKKTTGMSPSGYRNKYH